MKKSQRTWIYYTLLICLLLWQVITPSQPVYAQSGAVSRGDLILAMNTLRVSYGLPALIVDPIVNSVAQGTAETMAANNMSWHIGDVRGRIAAAGYGGGATVWATENFAVGNMTIDQIMQVWSDADHMRPAVNPAYCHVGAGVAKAANGSYYYILQAAYTSEHACGEYTSVAGGGSGSNPPPVSQVIIPVKVATPDAEGRIYHEVQAGQSLWSIAIAYKITIHDLEVWNNISRESSLYVGQKLFIPSVGTEGFATPTPVWMVVMATPDAEGKIVHEVKPYQAVILIAEAYQVPVNTILALNSWQADWPLQIGQKLLIDPGKPTPRPLSPIEQLTPDSDGNYYHTVKSGEYLAWIADLYDVNLADLLNWNRLTADSVIRPGQQLLLLVTPPATATFTPAPASPTATITRTPHLPQEPAAQPPSATATPKPAEPSRGSPVVGILLIVLVIAGALVIIWLVRRST